MLRLELELTLQFAPLEENGRGITLVRSFELPFPPTEGLQITGGAFHP